ncbi:hypothetical protein ACJX0J_026630, partial [Zea mays]
AISTPTPRSQLSRRACVRTTSNLVKKCMHAGTIFDISRASIQVDAGFLGSLHMPLFLDEVNLVHCLYPMQINSLIAISKTDCLESGLQFCMPLFKFDSRSYKN